ncbi:MAG: gliding motility-associated C-terminal domain-containing protein [Bacteroidia bacterium]|nr:gliding motility-associated C-terminal domain-containing protein [Bacteroidia bacterium]
MLRPLIVLSVVLLYSSLGVAQTCVTVNAGPDVTICAPNCTTLTATPVPSNQTTSYTQAIIPYAPDPFNVGTAVALTDDSQTGLIPLPFPFCYYGTVYNTFVIGSNGWVGFSATTSTWVITNPIPDASGSSPRNCIMGPWQDINPGVGGQVRYQVYGATPCRRLVVSWYQVPMYSCGTPATQQIVLYETTNIIDNFLNVKPLCAGWNGGKAIQGLHNAAGTLATVVPGRNSPTQWTANNEGRRYTPAGAATYTVSWYNGPTLIGTGLTINVCPTVTTTYTAVVTHTNCNNSTVTVTDQVTVNVNTLAVNVNPASTTICSGQQVQLNASAVGAISYSWSPATFLNNPNIANPIATPTVTTTYTVTVSDGVCSGTATVTINITSLQNANAGPDDTICYNGSTILNASGGVQYLWTPTTGLSNPNIANPTANPTVTTTYTVTVTDANGCTGTDQVTVFVGNQLTLTTAGFPTLCNGNCTGQATTIVAGGNGPFSYTWSNAATGANITGLCQGTYTVTVTDAWGCTATDTAIVSSPSAINLVISSTPSNCGQPDGSMNVIASGGVGPYSYAWTPGGYTTSTVNNINSGTYCVIVTDANGCTDSACVNVANNAGVQVSISNFNVVTCFGYCDGAATCAVVGGTGPFNYMWSPSGGTLASASGLCAGTYTVLVTDANGCTDTAIVTITQPPQLTIANIPSVTICAGACTTLTATVAGGTGVPVIDWQPVNQQGTSVNVCPTATTTYTVLVTDANNCTVTTTVTVTVRPPLSVNASSVAASVCPGACTTLNALGMGGNGGPYTYTWMPGNMNGNSVQACPTITTTYTVTVTDNCTTPSATGTVTITVNTPPTVNMSTPDPSGCESPAFCTSFSSTSTGTSFNWSFQGGTPSTATGQNPGPICFNSAGTYDVTLTVTDANGCTASATTNGMVTVFSNPVANFSWSPTNATVLNSQVFFTDLSINANTWFWTLNPFDQVNGTSTSQNPSYTYTDSGFYQVTLVVTSPEGCLDSITQVVEIKPDFTFYAPNAFTPNNDGYNDVWLPEGVHWDNTSYELYIYDRWGNLIFNTTNPTLGWNGRVDNTGSSIVQEDVYVWKVVLKDNFKLLHQYVGHVSVIR